MKTFLSRYSFIFIFTACIFIVGGVFIWVVELNLHLHPSSATNIASSTASNNQSAAPASPVATLTIEKLKNGNFLLVNWQNLPEGTTALDIFRSLKNSTSGWSLWKSIAIDSSQRGGGNTTIDLGRTNMDGYSFYIAAVNSSATSTILWTSPVGVPPVVTSTPPVAPSGNPSGNPGMPNPNTPGASSTPSSTPNNSPAPTSSPSNPQSTPAGTPFYNPQVQIEGYRPNQTQNFWVQHVDQKIQIGWQNLPLAADNIVVFRSENQDGPWNIVLTQRNPGVNGAYSIQIVDDTLGKPYFYEMNANQGSTTIATYGPVYLSSE